jgi:hypothetical protein
MKKIMLLVGSIFVVAAANADTQGILRLSPKTETRLAVNITYHNSTMNVWGGPMKATFNSTQFDAYCVDLDHWNTPTAQYRVNAQSTNNLRNGARAAYLYNTFASSVDSKEKGAALQLAIWDIVTDNGDGFAAGSFKANHLSNSVASMAQNLITQSAGQGSVATYFKAVSHGANCDINQNMMGPVPEPGTMLAMGAGLAAFLKRRRAAKKA